MQQGQLSVTVPQVKRLIDLQVTAFVGQVMDDVLYREIEAALNANIEPQFATDFSVSFGMCDGQLNIGYTHQGERHIYKCVPSRICVQPMEEVQAKIELAAAAVEAALEALRTSPAEGRLINVGRTQLQLGFMALRRSTEPNPEAM